MEVTMRSISCFVFGMIVGALLLFVASRYHVVRASDGVHLIPKASAHLSEPYVDIRNFTPADWDQHKSLAMAIVHAEKSYLLQDAAAESVRRAFDDLLGGMTNADRR
jgi:hypothetical protein